MYYTAQFNGTNKRGGKQLRIKGYPSLHKNSSNDSQPTKATVQIFSQFDPQAIDEAISI